MWRLSRLIVVSLLASQASAIQDCNFRTSHYGTKEGLPNLSVSSIAVDEQGAIWVATQKGLSRFSGSVFYAAHDAVDTDLRRITFDASVGGLWVWTESGEILFIHESSVSQIIPTGTTIQSIRFSGGNAWVVDADSVLWQYDLKGNPVTSLQIQTDEIIGKTIGNEGKALWIAGQNGLQKIRLKKDISGQISPEIDNIPLEFTAAQSQDFTVVSQLDGTGFALGSKDGSVFIANEVASTVSLVGRLPGGLEVSEILQLDNNHILVGTQIGGLWCMNVSTGSLVQVLDQSVNGITSIVKERSGSAWVGTRNGLIGLVREQEPPLQFIPTTGPDSTAAVVGLLPSRIFPNKIYFSLMQEGVHVFEDNIIRPVEELSPSNLIDANPAVAFAETQEGDLWVGGMGKSIYKFYIRSGILEQFELDIPGRTLVHQLIIDDRSDSKIFVATRDFGLLTFDFVTKKIISRLDEKYTGLKNFIWSMSTDNSSHSLVMAVRGAGIATLDLTTDSVQVHSLAPTSCSTEVITAKHAGSDFLVGTYDKGLLHYSTKTQSCIPAGPTDLLSSSDASWVDSDTRGRLWFSTGQSLVVFDAESGAHREFNSSNSLPFERIFFQAHGKTTTGDFVVGGPTGLVIVSPDNVEIDTTRVAPLIEAYEIDDHRSIHFPGMPTLVKLPEKMNDIKFFLGNDAPSRNDKVSYRLRLTSTDKWHHLEDNWIRFPALAAGRYSIEASATVGNGLWTNSTGELDVYIRPRLTRRVSFWVCVLAGLGILSFLIYRYRINELLRFERLRIQIAGQLHDDIGANLSTIALKSDILKNRIDVSPDSKKYLSEIGSTARNTAHALREVVWLMNSGYDTLGKLVSKMEGLASDILGANIIFEFLRPAELPDIRIPIEKRQHIYLVFKETLHNVVKHSGASYTRIEIQISPAKFVFSVGDNGKGFSPDKPTNRGFGLNGMQRRSKEVHGAVTITSSLGEGCEVVFSCPI